MVVFSCSVVSDSLRPHGLRHARPPCPSPSPRACSNSRPLSWWCYPTISSSVVPFSSCPQCFLASGSFPVSRLFASGGQSIVALVSGWCNLFFFFYCPPVESIVDFSAPEGLFTWFCLPLASHSLLLHKISKCQTMHIKKKKKHASITSHTYQLLSTSCADLKMETKPLLF